MVKNMKIRDVGVAQVVDHLPSKHKVLCSAPVPKKIWKLQIEITVMCKVSVKHLTLKFF
jgi:hypothetical protein